MPPLDGDEDEKHHDQNREPPDLRRADAKAPEGERRGERRHDAGPKDRPLAPGSARSRIDERRPGDRSYDPELIPDFEQKG